MNSLRKLCVCTQCVPGHGKGRKAPFPLTFFFCCGLGTWLSKAKKRNIRFSWGSWRMHACAISSRPCFLLGPEYEAMLSQTFILDDRPTCTCTCTCRRIKAVITLNSNELMTKSKYHLSLKCNELVEYTPCRLIFSSMDICM